MSPLFSQVFATPSEGTQITIVCLFLIHEGCPPASITLSGLATGKSVHGEPLSVLCEHTKCFRCILGGLQQGETNSEVATSPFHCCVPKNENCYFSSALPEVHPKARKNHKWLRRAYVMRRPTEGANAMASPHSSKTGPRGPKQRSEWSREQQSSAKKT